MPTKRQTISSEAIEELIAQHVANVLATYEANRNNENGNGSGSMSGNGSLCFRIVVIYCAVECQVKYATCNLLNGARTWWNSHVKIVGIDAAYDMSELWNLTVKGTNVTGYTQRFQELALLCPKMVPGEEEEIQRYILGFPGSIQGKVTLAEPTRLQDTIKLANSLMDQKVRVFAARQAENKKRKQGHYRSECPKLKNQNHRNAAGNCESRGRVYALGGGEANQDLNVIT
ncbi:hypothetical protein Tco_1444649, partial [Tanacetum coccineum]